LSEEVTRTITVDEQAQGFEENYGAAQGGGRATGKARLNIKREMGKPVVSFTNYLQQIEEAGKKMSYHPMLSPILRKIGRGRGEVYLSWKSQFITVLS
jgi:hypothetical protein